MADYFYQSEKLSSARRALMLPHSKGEAASISDCFLECSLALERIDESDFDENAHLWVSQIRKLMDTTGVASPADGTGAWNAKARNFTTDQKLELSSAVDELAFWFSERK